MQRMAAEESLKEAVTWHAEWGLIFGMRSQMNDEATLMTQQAPLACARRHHERCHQARPGLV